MNPNEIRHFNGYNPSLEKPRDVLPVGGYICKIIKAKAQDLPDGNQELDLMLEIVEGAYTGFFHRDYDSQNRSYTPRYCSLINWRDRYENCAHRNCCALCCLSASLHLLRLPRCKPV